MEEDTKVLAVNSYDQLYHILKTDTFTFCLICLEVINNAPGNVGKHLSGTNHAESIKCLFKACNPSLIDDIEGGRFVGIVLKSVFDISVLLGKETCYISKKENDWFCLMCEQSVTERNLVDEVIKDNIIDHVLSNSHVQKVKGVCFLYKLNGNQDFLLLNKSVVYCSVCKLVMQCKDVDLLKTTAVHLKMNHPNYAISSGLQNETSCGVKQEELKMMEEVVSDEEILSRPNHSNRKINDENFDEFILNRESLVENVTEISRRTNVRNHKGVKKLVDNIHGFKDTNIYICILCKQRLKPVGKVVNNTRFLVAICKHFRKSHKRFYLRKPLDGLFNSVIFHNDADKIKLLSKAVTITKGLKKTIIRNRKMRKHVNYFFKANSDFVCLICMVTISPCLDDSTALLQHFQNHIDSSSHLQCIKEQNQTLKVNMKSATIAKLTAQKEKLKVESQTLKAKRKKKRIEQEYKKRLKKLSACKLENPSAVKQEVNKIHP